MQNQADKNFFGCGHILIKLDISRQSKLFDQNPYLKIGDVKKLEFVIHLSWPAPFSLSQCRDLDIEILATSLLNILRKLN